MAGVFFSRLINQQPCTPLHFFSRTAPLRYLAGLQVSVRCRCFLLCGMHCSLFFFSFIFLRAFVLMCTCSTLPCHSNTVTDQPWWMEGNVFGFTALGVRGCRASRAAGTGEFFVCVCMRVCEWGVCACRLMQTSICLQNPHRHKQPCGVLHRFHWSMHEPVARLNRLRL